MEFNTEKKFNIEKKKAFPKEFDGLYGSYDAINDAIKNWFGSYYRSGQTAFDFAQYKTIQDELNMIRETLEQFLTDGGYLIEKNTEK